MKRTMGNRLFTVLGAGSIAMSLLAIGCSCEKEKKSEKPAPTATAKPAIPADVDQALLKELKEASVSCVVAKARQRVTCNGGEKNALVLSFNKGERDRLKALPTFTVALAEKDEKLQGLAAAVLYASFRTGLGAEAAPGVIKPEAADALIKATLALPDPTAMQAIPAATHAAMLSGKGEELVGLLTDDVAIQVRTMAYRYLMVYGRLDMFKHIRKLGGDPGAAVVLSAIESPRNMRDWTGAEPAEICPWAVTFLDDERPPVVGNAMAVLSNCAGEELDKLLDRIEKTLKDKQFSFIHSTALRDVCGDAQKRREKSASDEQCEKVRKLQTTASESKDVQVQVRAMSLSSMAYVWPDKKSLTLARKLAKDKEPEVEQAAAQVVTRLEQKLANDK